MQIYGICDPTNDTLRYVGFTKVSLDKRLSQHLKYSQLKKNTHKNAWIKSLLAKNVIPTIFLLQETNLEEWVEDERWNISYFKSIGCDLTNDPRCPGGEMPPSWRGRKHTQEHTAKIAASNKGQKPTAYCIERLIEASTGRKMSEYNRSKLRESNIGRKMTDDNKRKLIDSARNRLWTDEMRDKLSKANIGKRRIKKLTQEQRNAIPKLLQEGFSQREVAKLFNVSQTSIRRFK